MNTSRVSVTRIATGGRRPVNRAARDALMPDARDRWRKKKKEALLMSNVGHPSKFCLDVLTVFACVFSRCVS